MAFPKVLIYQLLLGISYHHSSLTYAGGTFCVVGSCVCYLVGVLKKPPNANNMFGKSPKALLVRVPLLGAPPSIGNVNNSAKKSAIGSHPDVFITAVKEVSPMTLPAQNAYLGQNYPTNMAKQVLMDGIEDQGSLIAFVDI